MRTTISLNEVKAEREKRPSPLLLRHLIRFVARSQSLSYGVLTLSRRRIQPSVNNSEQLRGLSERVNEICIRNFQVSKGLPFPSLFSVDTVPLLQAISLPFEALFWSTVCIVNCLINWSLPFILVSLRLLLRPVLF